MKKFILSLLMFIPALAMADETGKCGDNVTYRFDSSSQTLYISGQGRMYDYASSIPIGFQLSNGGTRTRGTEYINSFINEFEVWGFKDRDNTLYMGDNSSFGRKVTRSDKKWVYDPIQPWTSGGLSFMAVTPSESPYFIGRQVVSKNEVSMSYDINVPTDVKKQEDLLIAVSNNVPKPESYKPVSLEFKHVLSEILFKSRIENFGYGNYISGTVKEISLVNVYSDGHLTYNGETEINDYHNKVTYTLVSSDFSNDGINNKLTSSRDTDKKNALFLLPQKCDGGGKIVRPGEPAPTDGKTYLKFRARLEWEGTVLLNGDEADAFYFPLDLEFNPGVRYTFCFMFPHVGYRSYDVNYSLIAEPMITTDSGVIYFDVDVDGGGVTRSSAIDPDIRPWEGYKRDIRNLIIGEGVTYVGEYTFDGLDNLESVVFPSSLKEIGHSSFNDCSSLMNIYCYATRVPEYAEDGLDTSSDNCKLHVPASAVDTYKQYFDGIFQRSGSKYFRYIDALQDGDPTPTSINVIKIKNDTSNNNQILTLNGQQVTNPKPGIFIQRGRKVIIK